MNEYCGWKKLLILDKDKNFKVNILETIKNGISKYILTWKSKSSGSQEC